MLGRGRGPRSLVVLAFALAMLCSTPAALAAPVTDVPVSFTVANTDSSGVPCGFDSATYTVRGDIIAPVGALTAPTRSATLYAHGLGFGEFFWHFTAVPGYDYATELASQGQVSVVIDRLGYGASGKPNGYQECYGAEADYLHQIVQQLRSGAYTAGGGAAPSFGRIALAGHSAGGYMTQIEAYSYRDVDALMLFSFAEGSPGLSAIGDFAGTGLVCNVLGGQRQGGNSGPGGYAYFGQTDADFRSGFFFNADSAVVAATTQLRSRDPCGDTASVPVSTAIDLLRVPTIGVTVLIVTGANDAIFPPPGGQLQKLEYLGSHDATQITLPATGHAITLGRTAPALRSLVGGWLCHRGFGSGCPA